MTEPDFNKPLRPIGEFAAMSDFPRSALGEYVDIGGYAGVVVEIVSHSIKVRSPEGTTQRFNYHTLLRLYGPRVEPEPAAETAPEPGADKKALQTSSTPPQQQEIENPDFNRAVRPIRDLAGRSDFPQCSFAELVEIGDYTGVVVSILGNSLKVRSRQGTSRRYNAEILRRLYGKT